MSRNQQVAARLAARIVVQVQRGAGRGVQVASRFLAARLKETLSEPAPRKPVRAASTTPGKKGGILYYRATTRATPGAPPRKLSGRLRTSVVAMTLDANRARVGASARGMPSAKHPRGFAYPKFLETGKTMGNAKLGDGSHPFVKPTVEKYRKELLALIGHAVKVTMR